MDFNETNNHNAIAINKVSKQFDTGQVILRDISFQVTEHTSTAIIGKNGSGKSTLLRCCIRLIDPTSGGIHLFNQDLMNINSNKLRQIRRQTGFIFQHQQLVPRLSVLSNVIHGALSYSSGPRVWLQAFATQSVREEAVSILESVGIAHLAGRRVDTLSGGEKQKVAIARAFMQKPKLILADEPAASLDPKAADEAMELLFVHAKQRRITLLFVTHHVKHALHFADRIIGIEEGVVNVNTMPENETESSLRDFFGE